MNKKLATHFSKWLDFFHFFNFDFSLHQILMCWGARSFERCFLGWQINTTNRADSSHLIFLALNLHLKISGIYNRLVTNGLKYKKKKFYENKMTLCQEKERHFMLRCIKLQHKIYFFYLLYTIFNKSYTFYNMKDQKDLFWFYCRFIGEEKKHKNLIFFFFFLCIVSCLWSFLF